MSKLDISIRVSRHKLFFINRPGFEPLNEGFDGHFALGISRSGLGRLFRLDPREKCERYLCLKTDLAMLPRSFLCLGIRPLFPPPSREEISARSVMHPLDRRVPLRRGSGAEFVHAILRVANIRAITIFVDCPKTVFCFREIACGAI